MFHLWIHPPKYLWAIPPRSRPRPFLYRRSAVKSSVDSSLCPNQVFPIFPSQQQLVAATATARAIVTVTGKREKDNKRTPAKL